MDIQIKIFFLLCLALIFSSFITIAAALNTENINTKTAAVMMAVTQIIGVIAIMWGFGMAAVLIIGA